MFKRLSLLVHGPSKHGKTHLAATAPKPMIVLDADDGWQHENLRFRHWNPMAEAEPVYDPKNPEWDTVLVDVREWGVVPLVYSHIIKQTVPYRSVAIDSVTEIQNRAKAHIVMTGGGTSLGTPKIQDWGTLLDEMVNHFRMFRYLAKDHPTMQALVFIAESDQSTGTWAPIAQGKFKERMPYLVDVIGFLLAENEGENGNGNLVRKLLLSPHPQFVTGKRGNLPDIMVNPTIPEMLKYLNHEEARTNV